GVLSAAHRAGDAGTASNIPMALGVSCPVLCGQLRHLEAIAEYLVTGRAAGSSGCLGIWQQARRKHKATAALLEVGLQSRVDFKPLIGTRSRRRAQDPAAGEARRAGLKLRCGNYRAAEQSQR